MSRFAVIVCAGLLAGNALAQPALPDAFRSEVNRARTFGSRVSSTGQFIVHDPTDFLWQSFTLSPSAESNFARLDASLLAISCEHIRSALLAELEAPNDRWHGSVSMFLHHARGPNEPVVIAPTVNGREWTYYVSLPDTLERTRLVSAVVSVLLLEIADRGSARSAEIPAWLAQGLTVELMCAHPHNLVVELQPKGANGFRSRGMMYYDTNAAPLDWAHGVLQNRPPLALAELGWPESGFEETDVFRAGAQIFVHELLHLPDGPRCLRTMIQELPGHLNWQLSFHEAFSGHFANELEVEKWWLLNLVNFTGRDLAHAWPPAESWHKLDEIIRIGADVRASDDELPLHTQITLQNVIRNWDYDLQAGVLKNKILQLGLLRAWVSPDYLYLTDDYREVLQAYVSKREKTGFFHRSKAKGVTGTDAIALQTLQQLDDLDARREQTRPEPVTSRVVTANLPADR